MPERPPVYLLEENRRTTRAIHDWARRWTSDRPLQTDAGTPTVQARAVGPRAGPEGAPLPPAQLRLGGAALAIHPFTGLEGPVVILAELQVAPTIVV